jgi:DNA-directed RNA polymerase I, II, and III subunit RPABC1
MLQKYGGDGASKSNETKGMRPIYRSYCILLEMLKDRGYEIPEDDFISYDEFIQWTGEDFEDAKECLTMTFTKEGGSTPVTTFWTSNLGTGDVKMVYETIKGEDVFAAIVIHVTKITPSAIPVLKSLRQLQPPFTIEPFLVSELQINITRHVDVPRHIICSAQKKRDVLKKYGVTKDQLPRILSTDPVCRYLGAKKGQLIKVIRTSESIPAIQIKGECKTLFDVSYRIVF